jgi:hypothetical protein
MVVQETAVAVREKREAFALWLQRKGKESREQYKGKMRDARTVIAESKGEANRRWGERVTSEF